MIPTIPAPGYTLTHGRTPRTGDTPLMIQMANGFCDLNNTYTADKLRWTDTGSGADIAAVRRP